MLSNDIPSVVVDFRGMFLKSCLLIDFKNIPQESATTECIHKS